MEGDPIARAHMVANVVNAHRNAQASPNFGPEHAEWYDQAHEHAKKIGGGDPEKGAGIIAALSPQTGWDLNLAQAYELSSGRIAPEQFEKLRAGDRSVLEGTKLKRQPTGRILKAHAIHSGQQTTREAITGPKTSNFARNIADPSDPHAVTIDFHAHDIAVGRPLPTAVRRGLDSPARYNYFADIYREARDMVGAPTAHEVQATPWVEAPRFGPGKKRG